MNALDIVIFLGFAAAIAATLLVSRRNSRRLSESDKAAAEWAVRQVRDYGPLSQAQVSRAAAAAARGNGRRGHGDYLLAHGLTALAGSMRDDERVTGSVSWWRRL